MSALEQARAFAAMAACGALSAAAYDVGMLFRRMTHAGQAAAGLMDLAFGAGLAFAVTLTALHLRIDPFRLYVLLGVAAGGALWFATAGAGIRKLLIYAGHRRCCVKKSIEIGEEVDESGRK